MTRIPAIFLLSPLSACDWQAPVVGDEEVLNVIQGEVVVNATTVDGPVIVLLYDAADPPPPEGTGRPVTLATIAPGEFVGGGGVQSAPFSITEVPDGTYIVSALLDVDADFHPLIGATAGATCGDWLGAYPSDLVEGEIGVVSLEGGALVEGVTVVVASEMPLERPAFVFTDNIIDRAEAAPTVTIAATDVAAQSTLEDGSLWDVLTLTGPLDLEAVLTGAEAYNPCDVQFPLYIPDDDGAGDGNPHPNASYAAMGLIELWPRFYLQYLGSDLEEGESYATEAVWALPALDASLFLGAFMTGDLAFETVIPTTELDLYVPAAAQHTLPDGSVETVLGANMPAGAWSLTVVSFTGQTWTLPNDLAGFASGSATYAPGQQGAGVVVE